MDLSDCVKKAGIKRKHYDKIAQFYSLIAKYITDSPILVDVCAGNGLASFYGLINNYATNAQLFDVSKPKRFDRLETEVLTFLPSIASRYSYTVIDVYSLANLPSRDQTFIISVHACGDLTDRIIEIGLSEGIPFAVMTCCHSMNHRRYALKKQPEIRLHHYGEYSDYLDLVRATYIQENGWDCFLMHIDKEITPRNHVLVGLPKNLR